MQHRSVLPCQLWCTTCTWASPRFGLTSFQSHLEKSFAATTNLLIPATPLPCVLRNVPVAALDHLREGESILPLPQPTSLSDVEIPLRDLVESTHDGDRVQHLWKKSRAVSLGMDSRGRCHQDQGQSAAFAWWHCCSPLQLGRLRRPSTRREAGSLGHSTRATGASQKSAGCVGCVHQVCRPQIRSPEGTNASFACVGFTSTGG